jgi:hypothetical protein
VEAFGVVIIIGAAFQGQVGWRDPLSSAIGELSGFRPAGGEQAVVGGAGEGESVDVGGSAGSPVVDVVDVGEVFLQRVQCLLKPRHR